MLNLPNHKSLHWHTGFSLVQQREPHKGLNCFLLSDKMKALLFPSALPLFCPLVTWSTYSAVPGWYSLITSIQDEHSECRIYSTKCPSCIQMLIWICAFRTQATHNWLNSLKTDIKIAQGAQRCSGWCCCITVPVPRFAPELKQLLQLNESINYGSIGCRLE